jgi:hypothetical protein
MITGADRHIAEGEMAAMWTTSGMPARTHVMRQGDKAVDDRGHPLRLVPNDPPKPVHTHVFLDEKTLTAAGWVRDEGGILARLRRNGDEWEAWDGAGKTRLVLRAGRDGDLEILHHSDDEIDENGEPDQVQLQQPPATEGQNRPVGDIGLLRPDRRGQGDVAGARALQQLLDRHYGQR